MEESSCIICWHDFVQVIWGRFHIDVLNREGIVMGFFAEFAGELLGKAMANAQEMQNYKSEYELMSDRELKREYQAIKDEKGTEYQYRRIAIKSVLTDRGYGQQ